MTVQKQGNGLKSRLSEKVKSTNTHDRMNATRNPEFQERLLSGLLADCFEVRTKNYDFYRFPAGKLYKLRRWIIEKVLLAAKRTGFVYRHFSIEKVSEQLMRYLYDARMERFYDLLGDEYSKNLFIELLKFRMLGPRHVKLPLNNKKYWDMFVQTDKDFMEKRRTIKAPFENCYLNLYQFPGISGTINLHSEVLGMINMFILKQYEYRQAQKKCRVMPGDTVIDGGACWGDTSLSFADETGEDGHVYGFEFLPDNLEILMKNIDLNQHLKNRITVIKKALWNKSKEHICYEANGPGSYVCEDNQQGRTLAETLSVDDFVRAEGILRVNFIKMDIEGSELSALQGAEKTIRKFRPKLAIALYHREDDFAAIPEYLDNLSLQYEFYMDHFTIHTEETVLFAVPGKDEGVSRTSCVL
jgi:FkbM family methyltransferase